MFALISNWIIYGLEIINNATNFEWFKFFGWMALGYACLVEFLAEDFALCQFFYTPIYIHVSLCRKFLNAPFEMDLR